MLPYALAIFTGAFLLFQVQPLIGKYILPWFGGSPGVWTTCLLFFQVLLLGGYAYAHYSSRHLKPRQQALLHLGLLGLSLLALPIIPSESGKPDGTGNPTWQILILLTVTLGLPYFVLSSTGPLMQQWFNRTNPQASPYRLYALSNIGSLLALISYPFYFESTFTRAVQATLWSWGLGLFAVVCGYCALRLYRTPANPESDKPLASSPVPPDVASPDTSDKLLWLGLSAIASTLLLATTNKLCQDVAVIPFLWVLPLCLYLLSFILCFDHSRWYRRGLFNGLLVIGFAVVHYLLESGHKAPLNQQIIGYAGTLFVACMVCHGELYRLRPAPRHLTGYYLWISAGGALGGLIVAVIAPLVFNRYLELQLGLWALSYLLAVVCFRSQGKALVFGAAAGAVLATVIIPIMRVSSPENAREWLTFFWSEFKGFYREGWPEITLLFAAFLIAVRPRRGHPLSWHPRWVAFLLFLSFELGVLFLVQLRSSDESVVASSRNFYGTLKVMDYGFDDDSEDDDYVLLQNGAITHGLQFKGANRAMWPTTYYGKNSGVGLALRHLTPLHERRIGLVGLGTGSLAAYGEPGDYFRIYEINSQVEHLARTHFTYLARCPAKVDVILGDARLMMENELRRDQPQEFDLLALDAFSSDAIPVHLLTREAMATYLQHLKPDGILAVHTSNRYLDLRPVVENLAKDFDLGIATIFNDHEKDWWIYQTTWILLTKDKARLEMEEIRQATARPSENETLTRPWTDDYTSLFEILKM